MGGTRYCTFAIGQLTFGIEAGMIREIVPVDQLGQLAPAGPAATPALELRRRLGLPPRMDGVPGASVVVRTPGGELSVVVDEVGEPIEVDAATFEPSPETLTGAPRELITGAHALPDRLLLVLDTEGPCARGDTGG